MKRIGLRWRLTVSIGLLFFLFAASFAFYFPHELERSAIDGMRQRGRAVSALLANLASAAIRAEELGGAEQLTEDLGMAAQSDQDIDYVTVVKSDGSIFSRFRRSAYDEAKIRGEQATAMVFDLDGENLHVRTPIFYEGARLGTLNIGFSIRGLDTARAEALKTALLVCLLIVGIGVAAAWLISQRLSAPILGASTELADVSVALVDSAREQESTSAQEAAAVAETRLSMQTLLDSAQQIADRSSEVLGNAERNAQSSQRIAERIRDLNNLGDKVAEILATIMQVADKADLLALNASLEGTKAGEAGKGFTLVANEMRRLAENVMESVNGIRRLMKDIQLASQGAAAASEDGQTSSADTASSARQIARLTQEQRQATEQVIESMDEMSAVLEHALAAVQRTNEAAGDARRLAGTLYELVGSRVKRSSSPHA